MSEQEIYLTEEVATQLKSYLDNGDLTGAVAYVENNQAALGDQYAQVMNWLSSIDSNAEITLDDDVTEAEVEENFPGFEQGGRGPSGRGARGDFRHGGPGMPPPPREGFGRQGEARQDFNAETNGTAQMSADFTEEQSQATSEYNDGRGSGRMPHPGGPGRMPHPGGRGPGGMSPEGFGGRDPREMEVPADYNAQASYDVTGETEEDDTITY